MASCNGTAKAQADMLGWAIERVDEARKEAEAAGEPFPDPVTETPRFIKMYNPWNSWFVA